MLKSVCGSYGGHPSTVGWCGFSACRQRSAYLQSCQEAAETASAPKVVEKIDERRRDKGPLVQRHVGFGGEHQAGIVHACSVAMGTASAAAYLAKIADRTFWQAS
jgi:hypothetical protein